MKVFIAVACLVASVAALGSGPYLPSGWRPTGPAFLLPDEVEKTSAIPLKDAPLQESVASGSEFLREYGPPKVQDLTKQYLPLPATEQSFLVIAKDQIDNEAVKISEQIIEASTQGILELSTILPEIEQATVKEETQTQTVLKELSTEKSEETTLQGRSVNLDIQAVEETTLAVETTEKPLETEDKLSVLAISELDNEKLVDLEEKSAVTTELATETANAQAVTEAVELVEENINASFEEKVVALEDVLAKEGGVELRTADEVKNIAEALIKLESDIKSQEINNEEIEAKTVEESSGSLEQDPKGFLEYGPPGFKEYGPPKEAELLVSAAIVEEPLSIEINDNNEVRRRRFSPKFRSTRKAH